MMRARSLVSPPIQILGQQSLSWRSRFRAVINRLRAVPMVVADKRLCPNKRIVHLRAFSAASRMRHRPDEPQSSLTWETTSSQHRQPGQRLSLPYISNPNDSCASLCRVSEVPHSLFTQFQPVSKWVLFDPSHQGFIAGRLLYCSCSIPPVCSQWSWTELKLCEVSGPAYRLGYGSADEIWSS